MVRKKFHVLESFQLESEKSTWNLSVIPPGFLQVFHLLVNSSWKIEIPCQFRLESTCNSGGFWLEFSYRMQPINFTLCLLLSLTDNQHCKLCGPRSAKPNNVSQSDGSLTYTYV